jgi:hypothetical protein
MQGLQSHWVNASRSTPHAAAEDIKIR